MRDEATGSSVSTLPLVDKVGLLTRSAWYIVYATVLHTLPTSLLTNEKLSSLCYVSHYRYVGRTLYAFGRRVCAVGMSCDVYVCTNNCINVPVCAAASPNSRATDVHIIVRADCTKRMKERLLLQPVRSCGVERGICNVLFL